VAQTNTSGPVLPRVTPEVPVGAAAVGVASADAEAAQTDPVSLLLVEDDASVREIIEQVLEFFGFRVVAEPDATSALDRGAEEQFACVVADVSLPDMPGPVLVDRLRELQPDLRALIVSGYPEDGDRWTSETTRFLPKPFGTTALARALEELGLNPSPPTHRGVPARVSGSEPA
jgi:CheY-like chemotaxis protein